MSIELGYQGREEARYAVLTVNRPEARNALNLEALGQLDEHLRTLERAVGQGVPLRAVVLTGEGEKAFISGGDLKELAQIRDEVGAKQVAEAYRKVLNAIENLPVPAIAGINGVALGGGMEVALACDFRIMAVEAGMAFKQVKMGLVTGWGSGPRLIELVGRAQANRLLMLGENISAQEALHIGLVHQVVQRAELFSAIERLVEALAANPPLAVRAMKQAMNSWRGLSLQEAQEKETQFFARVWITDDHWEASRATLEKRSPRFLGK